MISKKAWNDTWSIGEPGTQKYFSILELMVPEKKNVLEEIHGAKTLLFRMPYFGWGMSAEIRQITNGQGLCNLKLLYWRYVPVMIT